MSKYVLNLNEIQVIGSDSSFYFFIFSHKFHLVNLDKNTWETIFFSDNKFSYIITS